SMQQIGTSASSHFETKARSRGTDFLKEHKLFGENKDMDLSTKSINAITRLDKSDLGDKGVWADYKKAYDSGSDIQSLSNNKSFVELLQKMLIKAGKEDAAKNVKFGDRESIAKGHIILDSVADGKRSASGGGLIKGNDDTGGLYTANDLDKMKKEGITSDVIDPAKANNEIKRGQVIKNSKGINIQKIELNGVSLNGILDDNGDIESFTGLEDYKDIARYINNEQVDTEGFEKLMTKLSISDSKKIKEEVGKYFKNGKIDITQDNGKKSDIDDFLKKNNPKETE
ncbi:MAG: hypothetical protein QM490_03725, partial [Candidatus Gracilibacteria bacterium]